MWLIQCGWRSAGEFVGQDRWWDGLAGWNVHCSIDMSLDEMPVQTSFGYVPQLERHPRCESHFEPSRFILNGQERSRRSPAYSPLSALSSVRKTCVVLPDGVGSFLRTESRVSGHHRGPFADTTAASPTTSEAGQQSTPQVQTEKEF